MPAGKREYSGTRGSTPGPATVSEGGLEPPLVVATSAWPREALACQCVMLASDDAVFDLAAAETEDRARASSYAGCDVVEARSMGRFRFSHTRVYFSLLASN